MEDLLALRTILQLVSNLKHYKWLCLPFFLILVGIKGHFQFWITEMSHRAHTDLSESWPRKFCELTKIIMKAFKCPSEYWAILSNPNPLWLTVKHRGGS